MPRGGKRDGAGRPTTGRRRVVLQLTEHEEEYLRKQLCFMREIELLDKEESKLKASE